MPPPGWSTRSAAPPSSADGAHHESRYYPHLPLSAAARPARAAPSGCSTSAAEARRPSAPTPQAQLERVRRPRPTARSSCSPPSCRRREALDDAETLTYLHGTISDRRHPVAVPAMPTLPRRHPVRHAVHRRPRAEARRPASAHADRARLPQRDDAGHARRAQRSGFRLSLGDALHRARQDRGHQDADAGCAGSGSTSASRSPRCCAR